MTIEQLCAYLAQLEAVRKQATVRYFNKQGENDALLNGLAAEIGAVYDELGKAAPRVALNWSRDTQPFA